MNDYWLSQAAMMESELENVKISYEQMKQEFEERIQILERALLQANLEIQLRSVNNELKK
jgi:hypothetical protein